MPLHQYLRDLRQLRSRRRQPAVLRNQLTDIHQLRADAEQRGRADEIKRHDRAISALETHYNQPENTLILGAEGHLMSSSGDKE